MIEKVIRKSKIRDLLLAAVYGVFIAMLLGAPNLRQDTTNRDKLSPNYKGEVEIDGIAWGRWALDDDKHLLCPPGQSGFSLAGEKSGATEFVCGFVAKNSNQRCANGQGLIQVCQPNTELQSYYQPLGLTTPESFTGCCDEGQVGICRLKSERLMVGGSLTCHPPSS